MKNFLLSPLMTAAFFTGVCLIFFATFQLYQNSKTDGFNSGWIVVNQCQVKDADWRIYECRGDYTSNAGMMDRSDVPVTVTTGEPRRGDVVEDVYPAAFHRIMNTDYFVTGKERSSVLYNAHWLFMVLAGFVLPIGAALYLLGQRSHRESELITR